MKFLPRVLFIFLFTLLMTAANAQTGSKTNVNKSLAPMLHNVMPAVVNISSRGVISLPPALQRRSRTEKENNSDLDNRSYSQKRRFESIGSGVIINAKKGYILTNAHLVRDTDEITVTLNDGRHFNAKLLGIDNPSDIAALQIKADNLHEVKLANSDHLKVGDFVAAIGNPFGLNQTVTSGIVSGLERSDIGIEGYESFIQTDAPINPGNSGGALVDLKGHLVGINTAILAPDGGNIGIGFAIPVNMAIAVMQRLVKDGKIERGIMGVIVQTLTPELADGFGLPGKTGGLITEVKAYSSAYKAGLKVGDIITKVNDSHITTANQVRNITGLVPIGDSIHLSILRNGKPLKLSANVMSPKAYQSEAEQHNPYLFGAIYSNFNIHTASMGDIRGVQLLRLSQNSPLSKAHLRPGDIIIAANNQKTPDYPALQNVANKAKEAIVMHVVRADGDAFYKVVNRN